MKRTRHTPEQIATKLREADAMLAPDRTTQVWAIYFIHATGQRRHVTAFPNSLRLQSASRLVAQQIEHQVFNRHRTVRRTKLRVAIVVQVGSNRAVFERA